jgi:hypothetical protein
MSASGIMPPSALKLAHKMAFCLDGGLRTTIQPYVIGIQAKLSPVTCGRRSIGRRGESLAALIHDGLSEGLADVA